MQATARRLSVVSATSCARRRLIRDVRLDVVVVINAESGFPRFKRFVPYVLHRVIGAFLHLTDGFCDGVAKPNKSDAGQPLWLIGRVIHGRGFAVCDPKRSAYAYKASP